MANTIVQTPARNAACWRPMSGTAPVGAQVTGAIADRSSAAGTVALGGACHCIRAPAPSDWHGAARCV